MKNRTQPKRRCFFLAALVDPGSERIKVLFGADSSLSVGVPVSFKIGSDIADEQCVLGRGRLSTDVAAPKWNGLFEVQLCSKVHGPQVHWRGSGLTPEGFRAPRCNRQARLSAVRNPCGSPCG